MKERVSIMWRSFALAVVSLLFALNVNAVLREPRPDILGIRPDMSEEEVHRRLRPIGRQQKEENERDEGEQEVWILRDRRWNYLIVAFDREHRVRFVTVVARKGSRVRYTDVGDIKSAQAVTDGRNYTYVWKVAAHDDQPGYSVAARGSDPQYLTSHSIYRRAR